MVKGIEFEYEIKDRPTFSYLRVLLKKGQTIKAERGAMMFFEPTLELQTKKAEKGLFKSLKRKLAGETFLMNYFYANNDGWLSLAPCFPGDLMCLPLQQGESWIVYSGGYIASSPNLIQDTHFQGLKKSFFGGENAFFLNVHADEGPGDLFIGAMGAFIEWNLEPGQLLNVDNGHLVAMSSSIQMDVKRVGNWKATMFSGEGVVMQLSGPGKVIIQSRNPREYANWLYRFMPHPQSSGSGGFSFR